MNRFDMRTLALSSAMALALLLMPCFSGAAQADTKIAAVDVMRIMTESKAAQSIQKQLDQQRESFQSEFSKQEHDLQAAKQALAKQKATLSAEDFAKKQDEFEKKVAEARKDVQKRRQSLEKSAEDATNALRLELTKVVKTLADKNKYDLVLTRQNVILAVESMDITDQVLSNMNDTVKEIKLKVEK